MKIFMKITIKNWSINNPFCKLWIHFYNDSLFRNSIYLMLSTGVQAVFGFVFWLLVARLYTPAEIGIGSTLISASVFISYVSLLGFNNTLIKFLPSSRSRSEKISSSFILVSGAALIVSFAYIMLLSCFAPKLDFIKESFFLSIAFIFLSVFSAVNLLTDSIFIAYRASKYNLLIYTIQSIVKLALPLALVVLGAFGVFASSGLAATIALVLSLYYLVKKFNFVPKFSVNKEMLKSLWKFSSANYIANIFNIIPTIAIPIIIMNRLGAAQAGYYYLAFMICNLLYAVVYSVSQSLFAEGSYGEIALHKLFKRAALILVSIIIPAGITLALLGPFILQFFGKSYSEEASRVITVLALASPAVAAYIISGVLLCIMNRIYALVIVNIIYALVITNLSFLLVGHGIVWVAVSWMIGNLCAAMVAFLYILYTQHKQTST
jgi:O-antigen/teichoic acid export membrane protein